MKRKFVIILALSLLSSVFAMPTNAADGETVVTVYVITDGNITASFNASAGGDINYWIEDVEVASEFGRIWSAISSLDGNINDVQGSANYALGYAMSAYDYAQNNDEKLYEHDQTLMIHYGMINETTGNLYILTDEVVAFEGHYLAFENETNNTLGAYGADIGVHGEEIDALKAKVNDLNGIIMLIRNSLIGLVLIAGALYLTNRRYPFREIMKNGNGLFKNGNKQRKPVDFVKQTKAPKASTTTVKHKHLHIPRFRIKRKPDRSPLKLIKHLIRNPEKSSLRNLFSFLFFNK